MTVSKSIVAPPPLQSLAMAEALTFALQALGENLSGKRQAKFRLLMERAIAAAEKGHEMGHNVTLIRDGRDARSMGSLGAVRSERLARASALRHIVALTFHERVTSADGCAPGAELFQ